MSILPFIEIVLLFQPCFHCCTNFTFHQPTTSCINGLDFVSVVFRQHVNCSVDLISSFHVDFFGSRHCLQVEFFSSLSFPVPGINVPWTHCKLISSSFQTSCWKYTSTFLSYFSFSSVATRPFPLKIRAGFTFCSPSAPIQSCRVACRLSKPEDGCDTYTSLAPNVSQVLSCSFTNGTGTYLVDIVSIFRYPSSILLPYSSFLLCVFKAFLKSLCNFWIVSRPSSVQTFFLLVLLLSTMVCLFLNLCNHLLLSLNFAASSAP